MNFLAFYKYGVEDVTDMPSENAVDRLLEYLQEPEHSFEVSEDLISIVESTRHLSERTLS